MGIAEYASAVKVLSERDPGWAEDRDGQLILGSAPPMRPFTVPSTLVVRGRARRVNCPALVWSEYYVRPSHAGRTTMRRLRLQTPTAVWAGDSFESLTDGSLPRFLSALRWRRRLTVVVPRWAGEGSQHTAEIARITSSAARMVRDLRLVTVRTRRTLRNLFQAATVVVHAGAEPTPHLPLVWACAAGSAVVAARLPKPTTMAWPFCADPQGCAQLVDSVLDGKISTEWRYKRLRDATAACFSWRQWSEEVARWSESTGGSQAELAELSWAPYDS